MKIDDFRACHKNINARMSKINSLLKLIFSLIFLFNFQITNPAFSKDIDFNFHIPLEKIRKLSGHEDWVKLSEAATNFIFIGCQTWHPVCTEIKLLKIEALYGLRKINEADALLESVVLDIEQHITDLDIDIKALAEVIRARGLRQRTDSNLLLSLNVLSAISLNNLSPITKLKVIGEKAYVYRQLGDRKRAYQNYQLLMNLSNQFDNEEGVHSAEIGFGLLEFDEEKYIEAKTRFENILYKIINSSGETNHKRKAAYIYGNIGAISKNLGLYPNALRSYELARKYLLQIDAESYRVHYLAEIASAYRLLGKPQDALSVLDQDYFPYAVGGFSYHYFALHEKSLCLADMQMWAEAIGVMREAIELRRRVMGNSRIGEYVSDLAGIYLRSGNVQSALFEAASALPDSIVQNDVRSVWRLTFELFQINKQLGNNQVAIYWGKRSVNLLQQIRSGLKRGDKETQDAFLKHVQFVFEGLAQLLIETGRIAEAEQVLAMLKERELGQLVRGNPGAETQKTQADYVGAEIRASTELSELAAHGVRESQELAVLEKRLDAGEILSSTDEHRRNALLASAVKWRNQYQVFLSGLGALFAEAARPSATVNADMQGTRLQAKVALDAAGAIGLHYVVTDERVAIIVATPQSSFGRFSPVSRLVLNQQIGALRQAIVERGDTRSAAQALWKMLIEPVHADIEAAGAKTLVLSLTDTLRYLPFAALQDPQGRYLVEDYALGLWAAAVDVNPTASTANWQVAGLGLAQAIPGFSALPAVKRELGGIVRTQETPAGALPGRMALDEQFDRNALESALRGQTNVIHIASHFDFKPGDENRSVLIVGQGAPISLEQLAVMNFSRVEQLTLSACDTATGGGVNENGAEVEGLAAVVLRKQAKSVLATLWKVADESTARLMQDFYRQRALVNPPSRAQALRQAQLAMLYGQSLQDTISNSQTHRAAVLVTSGIAYRAADPDPAKPWAHPYYWAPFALSGSWL